MAMLKKCVLAGLVGVGALALASTGASARVVCNEDGDCWHVATQYEYKPDYKLVVHPDDWRWKEKENYRWREHEGPGYWRGGVWIGF